MKGQLETNNSNQPPQMSPPGLFVIVDTVSVKRGRQGLVSVCLAPAVTVIHSSRENMWPLDTQPGTLQRPRHQGLASQTVIQHGDSVPVVDAVV